MILPLPFLLLVCGSARDRLHHDFFRDALVVLLYFLFGFILFSSSPSSSSASVVFPFRFWTCP